MTVAAYAALLDTAGGGFSLAAAAEALAISRQAMHTLISTGRALGLMHGDRIVVPRLQVRSRRDRSEILPGIDRIVRLFEETKVGPWSALQLLTDPDPNLGTPPIAALRDGRVAAVEHAARAFLGTEADEPASTARQGRPSDESLAGELLFVVS